MTGIDPATWSPPVCDNGPHATQATDWRDRIWHRLDDGRLICGGCWTVGGLIEGDETDG